MNVENINKNIDKTRILVAPLDWGLGHATRCIPILKALIRAGVEVFIAAEGAVAALLEKEIANSVILPLKGYRIRYGKNKRSFRFKLLKQFPGILSTIKQERKWLDKMISLHKIDGVISDNRFGFHTIKIPCVFITHQLSIETGNIFLNRLAQKINYKYINRFDECWVPDAEGENNLAGKLSHPAILPDTPIRYLGILSRFQKEHVASEQGILILLSGPEPQRTIFEKIILKQTETIDAPVTLVRGLPASTNYLNPERKNLTILNHVPANELSHLIQGAETVVARCGYSTIMDLVALKKKAIVVPTPAQGEQEYLAKRLMEKNLFYAAFQEDFSLQRELDNIKHFSFVDVGLSSSFNEKIITDWIHKVRNPVS